MTGRAVGPFCRSLADRVRFARRVAGMTQHDLAAAIGSRLSQVRRYEGGMASISASTLLRIAIALDVPLGWLYGLDDGDQWPDNLLASLFHDADMPALVSSFGRITDRESRRLLLAVADGLGRTLQAQQPPPMPAAAVQRGGGQLAGGQRLRALVVDDAPDVLVVVGAFLRSGGYDVLRAHSAEAALEILSGGEAVDVLVTDYAMPGMSGLQLLQRAAALRPGLPVVVITAYAADLALAADRPGATMVLAKPFARADLLNAVRVVCTRAASTREA